MCPKKMISMQKKNNILRQYIYIYIYIIIFFSLEDIFFIAFRERVVSNHSHLFRYAPTKWLQRNFNERKSLECNNCGEKKLMRAYGNSNSNCLEWLGLYVMMFFLILFCSLPDFLCENVLL